MLAEPVLVEGTVQGMVDAAFRRQMCQLHTDLHLVNALAFQAFDGALVTGAQIGDDGTARIDLDLPGADNDRLRALEPAINDAIRQDLAVRQVYVPTEIAAAPSAGSCAAARSRPRPRPTAPSAWSRSRGWTARRAAAPTSPPPGQSPPVRILKVDNKGRHNRRIRIGLAG